MSIFNLKASALFCNLHVWSQYYKSRKCGGAELLNNLAQLLRLEIMMQAHHDRWDKSHDLFGRGNTAPAAKAFHF